MKRYFQQSVPLAGGQAYSTTEPEPLPLSYAILASRRDAEKCSPRKCSKNTSLYLFNEAAG